MIERGANHKAYLQSKAKEGYPPIGVLVTDKLLNKGSDHWTGTTNVLVGGESGTFRVSDIPSTTVTTPGSV